MLWVRANAYIKKIQKGLLLSRISYFTIVCLMLLLGLFLRSLTDVDDVFVTTAASRDGYIAQNDLSQSTIVFSEYGDTGVERIRSKYDTLQNDIQTYISDFRGTYGIYFYNISTGEQFGINDEEAYKTASTFKLPMNLCLFKKIQEGDISPKGTMVYLKKDYQGGTGQIQYSDFKKKYTVRDLARLSITKSDNIAATMIMRLIGKDSIIDYMKSVGGKLFQNDEDIVSSPADMGTYMLETYKFYNEGGALGKELMDYLLNTDFNDRLPAMLPSSVKVAHKIGTQVNVVNDVGIVFAQRPYVLAIMSKDVEDNIAPSVIATISRMVYDFEIANQEGPK